MDTPDSNSAEGLALASQIAPALLDQIGCGLLICDAHAMLRYANKLATEELRARRLLQVRGGQLCCIDGVSGDLTGAIRQAAGHDRRTLVHLESRADRVVVTTLPLPAADGASDAHALVLIGRRRACTDLELELVAAHYGLTLAERKVLAGLLRDARPSEIADAHSVKLSTVRTQITSLRLKLGARTIEGLLLRAIEVPPMASAL